MLPNGNVLVNWGSSSALTEFLSNGTPVFHAYVDSGELGVGAENYRGFRYNWTGLPNEEPAIVSLRNGTSTSVYVSWNGDTETKRWSFYGSGRGGKLRFLGKREKTGFETAFVVHDKVEHVRAEAVGNDGKILRSTGVVKSEIEVLQFQGNVKEEKEKEECRETAANWDSWLQRGLGYFRAQEL